MPDAFIQMLHNWQNFYILTGTASATLVGLIFIAASLGAGLVTPETSASVHTWVTPMVIHFGSVLLVALIFTVPTLTLSGMAIILGMGGLAGLAYVLLTARRMQQQMREHDTALGHSDWLWYGLLPGISYLAILGAGLGFQFQSQNSFDMLAAGLIVLLVLGVRNTWDLMLWIAQNRST